MTVSPQPIPPTAMDSAEFLQLIRAAKSGSAEAMGRLLEQCHPYLLAIANTEMDGELAGKLGASDIVQNSMLSAQRCIVEFDGQTRSELLAWLRGILINDLQQANRYFHTAKRHVAGTPDSRWECDRRFHSSG